MRYVLDVPIFSYVWYWQIKLFIHFFFVEGSGIFISEFCVNVIDFHTVTVSKTVIKYYISVFVNIA